LREIKKYNKNIDEMYLSRHSVKVDDNVCIVNSNLNFNNVLTSFVIISLFNSFFQIFFNVTARIVVKKVGIADINDPNE